MSWTKPIAEDGAKQIVSGWLDRMKAPPRTPGSQPNRDPGEEPRDPTTAQIPVEEVAGPRVATDPGVDCDDELDDEVLAAVASGRWSRVGLLGAVLGAGIGLTLFLAWDEPVSIQGSILTGQEPPATAQPSLPPSVEAVVSKPALARLEAPAPEVDSTPRSIATQVRAEKSSAPDSQATGSWQVERKRPKAMAVQYRRLLRRGWRAYGRGEFATATNAFSRAVHTWPDRTGGYFGMALSLFEQGAEDGAMQVLERGVKKVGPKTDLWVLAGSIYQFKGKDRPARMAYQRYLRSNPHGRYARDIRVILSYEQLPRLQPFYEEDVVAQSE